MTAQAILDVAHRARRLHRGRPAARRRRHRRRDPGRARAATSRSDRPCRDLGRSCRTLAVAVVGLGGSPAGAGHLRPVACWRALAVVALAALAPCVGSGGRAALAAALVASPARGWRRSLECARSGSATTRWPALAVRRAEVSLTARVTGDPVPLQGRFGLQVMVRLDVRRVVAEGTPATCASRCWSSATPVGAPYLWARPSRSTGISAPSRQGDLAAVLSTRGRPTVRAPPGPWWRASAGLRDAAPRLGRRPAARSTGAGAGPGRRRRRRDADRAGRGLPHLRAHPPARGVRHQPAPWSSGSLLVLARWLRGARPRGWCWSASLGVARLRAARPRRAERAAGRRDGHGRPGRAWAPTDGDRGIRALGVAVRRSCCCSTRGWRSSLGLRAVGAARPPASCLLAPGLARRAGALAARAGLAEAVAVPFAAQLACTPLVAAISGQVSLVAVVANLLAAPVVGPATVLGLLGGVLEAGAATRGTRGRQLRRLVRRLDRRGGTARRRGCPPRPSRGGPAGRRWSLLTVRLPAVAVAGPRLVGSARRRAGRLRGAAWSRAGPAADPGLAAAGLGAGRLRRRAGRRPGAGTPGRGTGRGRRRRPGPAADGPLPRPASASTRCRWWC